jgi:hypothetical protein
MLPHAFLYLSFLICTSLSQNKFGEGQLIATFTKSDSDCQIVLQSSHMNLDVTDL